jgi:outer membrane protein assembly factor BamB
MWGARTIIPIGMVVAVLVALTGCGSSPGGEQANFPGSGYPNFDAANTRNPKSQIDSSNVSSLGIAWMAKIPGYSDFGSYAATPVIDKGVVYSQDLASNVQALRLDSGKVLWSKYYAEQFDVGPNGVMVAGGRVFGATTTNAFALDKKTGKQLWSTVLVDNGRTGVDMAPGYHDGMVYVSTVPATIGLAYRAGAVGTLWALDAKTGEKLWHFDTVPPSLWGNKSVNSGGGVWYTPAFDEKGFMYFGTGNPLPIPGSENFRSKLPWGSSRPGPNLYTDSLIKMNAKTGKLVWYHQVTPHDVYDWDFQGPPILMKAGGRQIVVAAGKSGIVLAADRETGKVIWQRAVGIHNGHDKDGIRAMHGEFAKLKTPMTVYPGQFGGVIAPMSTDGADVFVPVVNEKVTYTSPGKVQEESRFGELVALDAATGEVKWSHVFLGTPFGATTAVNDVVFTTTYEGVVWAFDSETGQVLWREKLPTGTNAGVMANGEMLVVPAGVETVQGKKPEIVTYRLGG